MIDFIINQSEETHGFITAPRRSSRYPSEVINDLNFADNYALFENFLEERLKSSFTTSCYRIILGIKRMDFISNEEVLKRVKQDLLIQLIQQRQLYFLGHIVRKPENELVNRYVFSNPKHGKREPGRPKLMFHQYIATVISQAYPPMPEEIRSMVKHWKTWKKLVTDSSAVG